MKWVVVVACDENLRQMEQEILELEGYRVRTAGNGREALRLLRALPYRAVVLLDFMMPYINGVGVLRTLGATPHIRARFAVILQSASVNLQYTVATLRSLGSEFGPDGTLTMPFTVDELLAAIEHGKRVLAARR